MRSTLSCSATAVTVLSLLFLGSSASVHAAKRETKVPNNFFNMYVGFTSVSNTNITQTGDDASLVSGSVRGGDYTLTLNGIEQKNNVWGGMGVGHWFTQVPISFGMSGGFDVFVAKNEEQQLKNVPWVFADGRRFTFSTYTTGKRSIVQFVPNFNLIAGIPLKFLRVYAGIGPGLFIGFYSFSFYSGNTVVGTVPATDAKIGYNAFAGVDVFITRTISVFIEGKYSQVDGMKFEPDPNDPLLDGRNLAEEYDSIKTQRVGIGLSIHF